jgi:hypothetical protein
MSTPPHEPLLDIRTQIKQTFPNQPMVQELVFNWVELGYSRGRTSGLMEAKSMIDDIRKFHAIEP